MLTVLTDVVLVDHDREVFSNSFCPDWKYSVTGTKVRTVNILEFLNSNSELSRSVFISNTTVSSLGILWFSKYFTPQIQ
jgi:hypothetical protein